MIEAIYGTALGTLSALAFNRISVFQVQKRTQETAKIETLKKVSIPKTVTNMGQCVFQQTKNLEECTFEHTKDSGLKTLKGWMFYGTALKAISLPDCIEVIDGENHFNECPNLTAVYLPANLTTFNTSATHEKSSFCGDEKMYLVNEPFTYDNIPVKPAVYYFPANLTTISGESFKNCKNLDYVFVFGDKVTKLENAWAFCGTGSVKLVFLGNVDSATELAVDLNCHLNGGIHGLRLVIDGPGLLAGHLAGFGGE